MSKTDALIRTTLKGLTATAIEKICVLGKAEAAEDITAIRRMVVELVEFWDLDERHIDQFDMDIDIGD